MEPVGEQADEEHEVRLVVKQQIKRLKKGLNFDMVRAVALLTAYSNNSRACAMESLEPVQVMAVGGDGHIDYLEWAISFCGIYNDNVCEIWPKTEVQFQR